MLGANLMSQFKLNLRIALNELADWKRLLATYVLIILAVEMGFSLIYAKLEMTNNFLFFPLILGAQVIDRPLKLLEVGGITRKKANIITMIMMATVSGILAAGHLVLTVLYEYINNSRLISFVDLLVENFLVYFLSLNFSFAVFFMLITIFLAVRGVPLNQGTDGVKWYYLLILLIVGPLLILSFYLAKQMTQEWGAFTVLVILLALPIIVWRLSYFVVLRLKV